MCRDTRRAENLRGRAHPYEILTGTSQTAQGNNTARCLTSPEAIAPGEVDAMRARVLVIALAGLVVVGVASAALARPPARDLRGDVTRADLRGVNFVESCRFSHQAPDDPIVFPGEPGASHQHTFVGNRTTDAFSTFGSLRSARTSCARADDTAAYWVPALYQGASIVLPARGDDLLPARHGLPGHDVPERAADDRRRRGRDEPAGHARDVLELRAALGRPTVERRADLSAGRGSSLRLHVRFPSCWDGRRLDSPDHKSHMAYAVRGLPGVAPGRRPGDRADLPLPDARRRGFTLASGGEYSAHADFFNAWRPER